LAWAIAPVDKDTRARGTRAYPRDDFLYEKLADLPNGDPNDSRGLTSLRELISAGLAAAKADEALSGVLENIAGVGVSTIGITNRRSGRLTEMRRKPWRRENDQCVLDILDLIASEFPHLRRSRNGAFPIAIHNDATAKAMAHRCFVDFDDPRAVLCYAQHSDGINIGFADQSGPLSSSDLHPEMGHSYPRLTTQDATALLDPRRLIHDYAGCNIHEHCFEGMASGTRIRRQWHHRLDDLPVNHEAFEIIPDYIAQLCWNATLAVAPTRIIIGGSAVPTSKRKRDHYLEQVRAKFRILNRGNDGKGRLYLRYDALTSESTPFIQIAPKFPFEREAGYIREPAGLMGALELGRVAARGTRPWDMVRSW
jgi:predicted NBD/HSP70 family sugar kinase